MGAEVGKLEEACEFGAAPSGGNAELAVVDGEGVPAQQRARGAKEVVGEGVAVKVLDEDETAGDAVHFDEEADAIGVGEMVEEEGAMDDVAGGIGEGKAEGIGGEAAGRGALEVAGVEVEDEGAGGGESGFDG